MLVWSPNNLLSDAMCKYSATYTSLSTLQRRLQLIGCPANVTTPPRLPSDSLFAFTLVDEYILMAKEKHGYNVEQVRKPVLCTM